jgi:hypothetical protein
MACLCLQNILATAQDRLNRVHQASLRSVLLPDLLPVPAFHCVLKHFPSVVLCATDARQGTVLYAERDILGYLEQVNNKSTRCVFESGKG